MDAFEQLLFSLPKCHVLDAKWTSEYYIPLDLSTSNKQLQSVDLSSSDNLGNYIDNHIEINTATVAYGGYLEKRNIYNRSDYFNTENPETLRHIHLGLDLWIVAETPVFTPLDARVHSFKNNTNFGDYGPTIILEHEIQGIRFYTLYGHLSLESIENLKVGQTFKQGQQLATLGDTSINGDYPPHLHFQLIKDIQHYKGDYPGVSSQLDLEFYKGNCPDPNVLFDFK